MKFVYIACQQLMQCWSNGKLIYRYPQSHERSFIQEECEECPFVITFKVNESIEEETDASVDLLSSQTSTVLSQSSSAFPVIQRRNYRQRVKEQRENVVSLKRTGKSRRSSPGFSTSKAIIYSVLNLKIIK
ncbi:hypothetical protein GEMRC1_006215 [Eukaryota sp. GEM-RC1]